MPFTPGGEVQFPAEVCAARPLRERCTTSPHGRSVSSHPEEQLLWEFRQRQLTPTGQGLGRRARYRGPRKNLFDLRRSAVAHNLHVIARLIAQIQHSQAA